MGSHAADTPDDWVDGSWTVDCVCGVNFDDGEEMVDCDECGVWVHTRCSRYVKSEKMFSCEKCKGRKSGREGRVRSGDGEEENEAAGVLVEMPNERSGRSGESVGFRRRYWTQVPREERVHVQGVPGGESGIFGGSGLSGVFGAGLWKATGYVPKKFGFQYKEFDWGGGNESGGVEAGVDGGSVGFGAGKRTQGEEIKEKKGEGVDTDVRSTRKIGMMKDRISMHSTAVDRGKHNYEGPQNSNDVSRKKKARAVHVERDNSSKRSPSASRPGKGFKVDRNVISSGKHEKVTGNVRAEPSLKGFPINGVGVDESKNTVTTSGQASETCVVSTHRLLPKARSKDECDGLTAAIQNSSKISNNVQLLLDSNDSESLSAKTKDVIDLDNQRDKERCVNRSTPMSSESAGYLQQPKIASYVGNNTTTGSGLMQRSETVNHLNCQQLSKVDHTLLKPHSGAPNAPATISDAEYALLLHQKLNRSSRVPRVPRMRHAGSLPQLASPTGANMLMKQSPSSSAGKDHGPVFKRKGKSIAEEGTQNYQRTNDSDRTAVSATRREVDCGSAPGLQSANKSNPPAANKRYVSSRSKSAQTSNNDTGSDIIVTRRTLPGLLSEIITKRMTYKELCDAVLPHWPYLRKNNGERYAYSSHSQAVLDCLRSRREWAQLVDRGPKSNAGRKRRRYNAEALSSEDKDSNKKSTEVGDCKNVSESCQDQFPKGKRKMRKRRRRLALQGRGLKNMDIMRKEKEAEDVSYDEDSSQSSSSSGEESMSSEGGTIQWYERTGSSGGWAQVSASE
ncbi:hypothetical protein ACET3Z_024137 [Daucus carota]